ncbi:MAG: hypothetical protein COB51_10295 [Moraxellaceae bacterium]|nr:MAG: hypothetical protein COB51_10295 [Moraxellaceae bacterium]
MNPDWQQFLQQNSATLKDGKVAYFADPDHELSQYQADNLLCDLSHLDLLSITGAEAKLFLQGQLTCDLEQIDESQFQLGAFCNPKGRTIASFRLFRVGDEYLLQTPPQMGAVIQQALNKYIIFSKAETQLNTNQWVCFGLMGAQAQDLLESAIPSLTAPTNPNGISVCSHNDTKSDTTNTNTTTNTNANADFQGVRIIRDFGRYPRYLIIAPAEKAIQLWQQLTPHCTPCGNELWALRDILEGYAQITPTISEQWLPHNLNYQAIQAINFKKGCYTGQEVIARMEYRGKLKTQMFIAYANLSSPPKQGQALINSETGKSQGEIINACRITPDRYALLVSLPKEAINSSVYKIDNNESASIKLEAVPYAIT